MDDNPYESPRGLALEPAPPARVLGFRLVELLAILGAGGPVAFAASVDQEEDLNRLLQETPFEPIRPYLPLFQGLVLLVGVAAIVTAIVMVIRSKRSRP